MGESSVCGASRKACSNSHGVPGTSTHPSNGRLPFDVYVLHRLSRISGGNGRLRVEKELVRRHPLRRTIPIPCIVNFPLVALPYLERNQQSEEQGEEGERSRGCPQYGVHPAWDKRYEFVSDAAVHLGLVEPGWAVGATVAPEYLADARIQFRALVPAVPRPGQDPGIGVVPARVMRNQVVELELLEVAPARAGDFQPIDLCDSRFERDKLDEEARGPRRLQVQRRSSLRPRGDRRRRRAREPLLGEDVHGVRLGVRRQRAYNP